MDVIHVFLRDFYIQKQFWSFENNLGILKQFRNFGHLEIWGSFS